MRHLGRLVIGLAVIATVSLIARAYMAWSTEAPDWKLGIDSLVGIVAVVTAVITYRALTETRKAADAAMLSAEAAMASSESLKRIERAHMNFTFPTFVEGPHIHRYEIGLINLGKTPGFLRRLNIKVVEGEGQRPADLETFLAAGKLTGRSYAAGQAGPGWQLEALARQPHAIHAAAEYEDIFGERHRTTFAVQYGARGEVVGPVPGPDWPD